MRRTLLSVLVAASTHVVRKRKRLEKLAVSTNQTGSNEAVTVSRPVGGVLSGGVTPCVTIHLSGLPGGAPKCGRAVTASRLALLPVGFT